MVKTFGENEDPNFAELYVILIGNVLEFVHELIEYFLSCYHRAQEVFELVRTT